MNFLRASLPPLATLLPFEAAARLESFSRAAEELNLTQARQSPNPRAGRGFGDTTVREAQPIGVSDGSGS